MARHKKTADDANLKLLITEKSVLGEPWVPIYSTEVNFEAHHFESAMSNLIRQPNINSTIIMRADILMENVYDENGLVSEEKSDEIEKIPEFSSADGSDSQLLHRYLDDVKLRTIPLENSTFNLKPKSEIIRRIIPRNPFKDHIINQTCLILTNGSESVFVAYIPHINNKDETPFYLPPVYGVGILYHKSTVTINYLPFDFQDSQNSQLLRTLDPLERPIRIAIRLLETSTKHSKGAKSGYEKRVNHDVVVPKIAFQNRYISLKKKYSSNLVDNWCESTDPKKHVFEDLAIAAFLIELWALKYDSKDAFEFRDLGCGNGLLVYILNSEGYKGKGIDARARKSWKSYPKEVQENLLDQIIIPSILLKPHPAVRKMAPHVTDNGRLFQVPETPSKLDKKLVPLMSYYSSANLLQSSQVCTTDEFPPNTFIIGNHSDELTCWIPLLNFPFIVIPCCSHALNGAKIRYNPRKRSTNGNQNVSTYGSLVDHVEDIAVQMGWKVEKEMLRIPSTRNAAIIGTSKDEQFADEDKELTETKILDILALEGGAEGWVENSMALMKKAPRNH